MTQTFRVRHEPRGNFVRCSLFADYNALGVPIHLGDLLMRVDHFGEFKAACPGLAFEPIEQRKGERK
jgi:hypothetical protein